MVHIWHGLGGHAESGYMRRLTKILNANDYQILRCNHRGCGSGRGLAKGIYHSGRGDDQGQVIAWARKKWPDLQHILLGFSLSGNAALYLGGKIKTNLPDAIIAVNAPIDLQLCSEALIQGFNKVYDIRFTRLCKKLVRERVQDGLLSPVDMKNIRNLAEFDDRVTAPLGGFKDRLDYYKTCSAGPFLKHIEVPTKILTAMDDPFVPVQTYHQSEFAAHINPRIAKGGGHMGYLGKNHFRWMDKLLLNWVKDLETEN